MDALLELITDLKSTRATGKDEKHLRDANRK
jgi:hypothetical protein